MSDQIQIKQELNKAIEELENAGIEVNSHMFNAEVGKYTIDDEVYGLGDAVEKILNKIGITEERFKNWFNLNECNCSKRKAWLNNILSWKMKKK